MKKLKCLSIPVNVKAPCIDCDKMPCGAFHDQCEVYKEFRAKTEDMKQKQREAKALDGIKKGFWRDLHKHGTRVGNHLTEVRKHERN